MVIVDTSVWIDFFRNLRSPETRWLDLELSRQRIGLVDIILCELLQGIRNDREVRLVASELRRLHLFSPGGLDFAEAAAENYRWLRRKGFTVRGTVDCWIATFCILERHMLLQRDRDFEPFERELGLQVVKP